MAHAPVKTDPQGPLVRQEDTTEELLGMEPKLFSTGTREVKEREDLD